MSFSSLVSPRICILDIASSSPLDSSSSHHYPHDVSTLLPLIYPDAIITTVSITSNARKAVARLKQLSKQFDLFINLYDGSDETGQKIVDYLEGNGLAFTGAGSRFYDPTKETMKMICRYSKIDTPLFEILYEEIKQEDVEALVERVGGFPLFVKPEYTFDSVGIDRNSLIESNEQLINQVAAIVNTWGSAIVEKYIAGREFSVLIVGESRDVVVFAPVEYKFADKSCEFITYDDKWVNYKKSWVPLHKDEVDLSEKLMKIAKDLYYAYEGSGYCRFDIRQDSITKNLHVLDVNPNCSVFYKDSCTADTIVEYMNYSKVDFLKMVISHAVKRKELSERRNSTESRYVPNRGFSLHAKKNFLPNDCVYSDEMCPLRIVTKQHVNKHWHAEDANTFDCYAWPVGPNTYAIWDADPKIWKPINHSCDPNVWMVGLEVQARREIKQGEELTIDYATFEPYHPAFPCWCGASDCRGAFNADAYKEEWFQKKYEGHFSPYMQHLVDLRAKGIFDDHDK